MLARDPLRERIESQLLELRFFTGSGSGEADVTSRVEPWSAAKPHFERLYGLASTAYDETDRNPFPGPFLARANIYDNIAQTQISYAAGQMAGDAERARKLGTDIVSGKFLDPSSNLILVEAIDVAVGKARDALLEDVVPQILDVAVRSGAYSGTATDIIVDRALEGFSREALRATTGIYFENYTRERAALPGGVEVLKVAEQIDYERGKLYQGNADLVRQLDQIDLNEAIAQFEEDNKAHWRGQQEYMAIMTGGGFSQTTGHDPSKQKNVLGSTLQGAVGGASLGASVGGAPGAGIGAVLGGLASLLGG